MAIDDKEFIVQIAVTSTHQYTVDARSKSEAIRQAEGMYEDGNYGDRLESEIEMSEAFESDDETPEFDHETEEEHYF